MRRGLLTVAPAAAAIAVGSDGTRDDYGFSTDEGYVYLDGVASDGTGTITTVRCDLQGGGSGSVAFLTYDPVADAVRAVSASLASVSGVHDYGVSLAIETGDLLGVWFGDGAATGIGYALASGLSTFGSWSGSKPVPTQALGPDEYEGTRLVLSGVGT